MKKPFALILAAMMLLSACGQTSATPETTPDTTEAVIFPAPTAPAQEPEIIREITGQIVDIVMNGQSITVDGSEAADAGDVYISRDIIYYESRTHYESGNPYGDGSAKDMHTAEEAAEHLVVNITAPGNYRVSGTLDKGQIRIDLGQDAYEDPNAVVNLILDGADITCTVAPAILFRNVYECDGNWSVETAKADVDTSAAGANLILADNSVNTVSGSYVAKIYKDKEGEKKQVKQDGAVYSYMSMNVYGPGSLDIRAENEGLDSELHLTIYSGKIAIRSDNDGINTNEDGVSVTTIWGGQLHIMAGLGAEGDGIDSNGYLVIHGGTVVSAANPAADAGLDSDLGSFIHGGTVIALGSTMDWAESDSEQVTMNLQFASRQSSDSSILVAREDGTVIFAYDPATDEVLGENARSYQGAVISCPHFLVGDSYAIFVGSKITGTENIGIYDVTVPTSFTGGLQMAYTGTDVMTHPGFMGDFGGGQRPEGGFDIPEDRQPGQMPTPPEGDFTVPEGDFTMPEGQEGNWTFPEGDWSFPEGQMPGGPMPGGQMPGGNFGGFGGMGTQNGEAKTIFYMQDKVNFFSGLSPVA